MTWDPDRYLRFADHRARPGLELIARIPDVEPRTVVDLGCGPGNLTKVLAERWPSASVIGIDSSAEMIDRARAEYPDLTWRLADIAEWEPREPVDVIYSNATLHWLADHHELVPRLRSFLAPGGVLAIQMPDNWSAPTHQIPMSILDEGEWPAEAVEALLRDPIASPSDYRRWVAPASTDIWRTTYHQELTGEDPVWTWVTGSLLRPVLAALDEGHREVFGAECRARYAEAYPPEPDGVTIVPFSRLFIVARSAD